MLRDLLETIEKRQGSTDPCRLFQVCSSLDSEDRQVLMRVLLNKSVSSRQIHKALREGEVTIDRDLLTKQRQCMKSSQCSCDWDSLS